MYLAAVKVSGVVVDLTYTENSVAMTVLSTAAYEAAVMSDVMLFVGTHRGIYCVSLLTGSGHLMGNFNSVVGHLSYWKGQLLVACPFLGPLQVMQGAHPQHHPCHQCGLYVYDMKTVHSKPVLVWEGDARSCAISEGRGGVPRFYIGTEPADVLFSDDCGLSWQGSNSFRNVASRPEWYCPTADEPHVLSLDFLHKDGGSTLICGVEVGGVLVSSDGGQSWEDRSHGLCRDVHCVRVDPLNKGRMYALTGSGSLPGGLYRSKDEGKHWRRMFGYRQCTGLALNPAKKGEMLITAADKAPSVGTYIFHSTDSGKNWSNITDDVFDQLKDEVQGISKMTPVPFFTDSGCAILGLCTGEVLCNESMSSGKWRVLCRLPARISAITSNSESGITSSIMH